MREGSLTERRSGLQLVAQIKTLRRSQSTRNQSIKGSHTPLSPPPNTIRAASIESNRRHDRLLSPSGSQQSENSGLHKTPKAPVWRTSRRSSGSRLRKQVNFSERRQSLRTFNSPLSEEITSHRFPRKFVMPSFECYSGATDPIQYLRQY